MTASFNDYLPAIVAAIPERRSVRNYLTDPLSENIVVQLQAFIDHMALPFPHEVKIALLPHIENKSVFYFPSPMHYAAFITPRTIMDQAKLGFAGELFILYAVSIGLSTCWMGHFNTKLANLALFGKPEGDDRLYKAGLLTSMSARLFSKKKAVSDHLTKDSLSIAEIPSPIRTALDLACKAPSAMNNQCWYYSIKKGVAGYEVEIGKPRGYKHFKWAHVNIDVGTAAAHFWAGMEAAGIPLNLRITEDGDSVQWRFSVNKEKDPLNRDIILPPI
jgi:hypothetical protein